MWRIADGANDERSKVSLSCNELTLVPCKADLSQGAEYY